MNTGTPTLAPAADPSAHLLTVAREIGAAWAILPGLTGAALIGSAAEGRADAFSDLDLKVFHDADPTPEGMEAAMKAAGGTELIWRRCDPEHGEHSFYVGGVHCQVHHFSAERYGRFLGEVLLRFNASSHAQSDLASLSRAVVLFDGTGDLTRWREAAGHYPEGLAERVVRYNLGNLYHRVWLFAAAERGDRLSFSRLRHNQEERLLSVWAGLNGRWFHANYFKGAGALIGGLEAAPTNLAAQWRELSTAKPKRSAYILDDLACETFGLAHDRYPHPELHDFFRYYTAPARIPADE